MPCAEPLRVQAYFDAELDASAAAEVERHLATCAECRALLDDLERARTFLRRELLRPSAPPALRQRLLRALDGEAVRGDPDPELRPHGARSRLDGAARRRSFWLGAISGMAGTAAAVATVMFWPAPSPARLVDQLIGAHVQSLLPDHTVQVVSTDQHTVKPWFAGRADVSPVVADFAPQGYRLLGGRAEHIDRQRAAVVVYQHGLHVINVFTWAAGRVVPPATATRSGYHLACWKTANLENCAVSDASWAELDRLVALLEELAARDQHPAARE